MPRSPPPSILPVTAFSNPSGVLAEKRPAKDDLIMGPCPYSIADHPQGIYTPQYAS